MQGLSAAPNPQLLLGYEIVSKGSLGKQNNMQVTALLYAVLFSKIYEGAKLLCNCKWQYYFY